VAGDATAFESEEGLTAKKPKENSATEDAREKERN
jgi:hypothetical protein